MELGKKELKKLDESLFILHKCKSIVNRIWELIQKEFNQVSVDKDVRIPLTYYSVLEVVSFLDEYNGSFVPNKVEPEYSKRVMDVRKVVKPIVKQIESWTDLRQFRNTIVAHPWRNQKNNDRLTGPDKLYDNVPKNWFELGLMVDLVNYVGNIIEQEFKVEIDDSMELLLELVIDRESNPFELVKYNSEIEKMGIEVFKNCQQLGKTYKLKFKTYYLED